MNFISSPCTNRQWLDPLDVCSGELNGHRFYVLCDPASQIAKDYGPNWNTPMSSFKSEWPNVDFKNPINLTSTTLVYYNQECNYVFLFHIIFFCFTVCLCFVYYFLKFGHDRFIRYKYHRVAQRSNSIQE